MTTKYRSIFKHLSPFLVMMVIVTIGACEDKHDINGLLDGNWQLIAWHDDVADTMVTDNNSLIYYTVKLQLLQIQQKPDAAHFSHFKHTGDSLILLDAYYNLSNTDSVITFAAMKSFGVPTDGKFCVKELSSSRLQLQTPTHTLTFRRY